MLRECADNVYDLGRPCLYHEMGRCGAPCIGGDGLGQYELEVDRVRRFLTGQDAEAVEMVEDAMRQAAATREYEAAGWYRDQLHRLQRTMGRQRRIASAVHEHHAVLVEPLAPGYDGLEGGAHLFLIRHGRLAGRVDLPLDPGPDELADLRAALAEAFDPGLAPPESHLRPDVDEMRMLANWMRLHPDGARQVRWHDGLDLDAFLDRVVAAAHDAVPTEEAEIEEADA